MQLERAKRHGPCRELVYLRRAEPVLAAAGETQANLEREKQALSVWPSPYKYHYINTQNAKRQPDLGLHLDLTPT